MNRRKLGRIGPGGWHFVGRSRATRHRGLGWNVVHVAVDDATRLAYAEELPDELGTTAAGCLRRWPRRPVSRRPPRPSRRTMMRA